MFATLIKHSRDTVTSGRMYEHFKQRMGMMANDIIRREGYWGAAAGGTGKVE